MHSSKILIAFIILTLTVSFACNKNNPPVDDAVEATLHDYTGLDGCTWVIKLENNEVIEPVNLNDFDFELNEGKLIWIKYFPRPDLGSFCMVGQIVEIESIWDR